ncbi:hypothetical protein Xsto_02076 [Xenorhabdus stockiae]|uniref:Retropepsins domain-containing protein n=1 Tax=Xenorhabdus stockiae TaxID=351614 RepID=A0A2D0KQ31_9GAMM|nr:hypothetical protein [Xenorhabdus stockiae]PHM65498.1 hypothetical protein Xsto_02076 [Xenorhabdus stockiae]
MISQKRSYFQNINKTLGMCIAALFFTIISAKTVKADITAPIVYLDRQTPSVSLNINGKEIDKIEIDTGASSALYLPQSVFDSIFTSRDHNIETSRSNDVFGNETLDNVVAKAVDITVNGEKLSGVDVEVLKPWGNGMLDYNGQLRINGLLGLGVVKNNILIIDYPSKVLTITDNAKKLPAGYHWKNIPFTRKNYGIEVSVSSGNKKLNHMVIDTGASHTIIFTRSKEGCVDFSLLCPKQTIVTPDGVELSAFLFQVHDERINFDGLLGDDYLSNKALVISDDKFLIGLPK